MSSPCVWKPNTHPVQFLLDRLDRLRAGLRLATYGQQNRVRQYRSLTEYYQEKKDIVFIECKALTHLVDCGIEANVVLAPIRQVAELIEQMTDIFPICEADMGGSGNKPLDRYQTQFKLMKDAQTARVSICRLMALCGDILPDSVWRDSLWRESYSRGEMPEPYPPEVEVDDSIQDVTAPTLQLENGRANSQPESTQDCETLTGSKSGQTSPAKFLSDAAPISTDLELHSGPPAAMVRESQGNTESLNTVLYTNDCSTVTVKGNKYYFTGRQRPVIKALIEAFIHGTPGVSQLDLLEKSGSTGTSFRDIFKESREGGRTEMHKAWNTLVVKVKKDIYSLQLDGDPKPRFAIQGCSGKHRVLRK
ncbi:MAG: hypothetical protein C0467_23275 [Planctomycetaceae bacterium]|nr:hypothetical protein [Planctomycetaceae bacterium]